MTREAISAICKNYRAGDPDPREPGTGMQVQFKEFALDFDNFVVPQEAANPNPNPSATPTPNQVSLPNEEAAKARLAHSNNQPLTLTLHPNP